MDEIEQRVDCRCPRVQHQHGTWLAYTSDRCRCTPCRAAWAAYTRQRRRRIAQASWTRWPLYVTPHGTARRLQALAVLGYGANELARMLGKPSCVVQDWRNMHHEWIYGRSAAAVADLYDRLWCTPSTDRYAAKTRNVAARRGWAPPLAWDDDTIDDPGTRPSVKYRTVLGRLCPVEPTRPEGIDEVAVERAMRGEPVPLTVAERHEAHRRLDAAGMTAREIARRLRVTPRTVQRRRAAA